MSKFVLPQERGITDEVIWHSLKPLAIQALQNAGGYKPPAMLADEPLDLPALEPNFKRIGTAITSELMYFAADKPLFVFVTLLSLILDNPFYPPLIQAITIKRARALCLESAEYLLRVITGTTGGLYYEPLYGKITELFIEVKRPAFGANQVNQFGVAVLRTIIGLIVAPNHWQRDSLPYFYGFYLASLGHPLKPSLREILKLHLYLTETELNTLIRRLMFTYIHCLAEINKP